MRCRAGAARSGSAGSCLLLGALIPPGCDVPNNGLRGSSTELHDRSLTLSLATRGTSRGKWYCQVALADASGERSKTVINADDRHTLPHWFTGSKGRMRRKETVKPTKGTDANALVVLVAPGDHPAMIRLYFATKVWILSERISGPADGHLPHMERTDLVNPILLDFLRSVDSAAPAAPER